MHFPDGSSGRLSFDKKDFDDPNDWFSVDGWIQRFASVPLDVLRDDLGLHLKYLRSSLIELINQDYGQFVNLSSNLVGLDGKILSIMGPLNKAQSELQKLNDALNGTLTSLQEQINYRRELRSCKAQLRCLRLANAALEASTKYINNTPKEIQLNSDFSALCLACDEIEETNFLLQQQSSDSPVVHELKVKLDGITQIALKKLASLLQVYADDVTSTTKTTVDNEAIVKSLLHMYFELNAESTAEEIFVQKILKPKCDVILAKKGNSTALLDEIEVFISICPLIQFSKRLKEFPWLANYDFVGRGVFPQVISILTKHFPHIWSPSIPDSFHLNWSRCEAFITAIESTLPSFEHLDKFRESTDFKDFIAKWQFPVYFQLRFHTFAIELETALETIDAPSISSDFKLDATRVTIRVIKQCWDKEKVFISHIAGRFLKASALFTSRYLKAVSDDIVSNKDASLELLVNTYCDLNFAEMVIGQILTEKINEHFSLTNSQSDGGGDGGAQEFLSGFSWDKTRVDIEKRLTEIIVGQIMTSMSAVTEVPRLFRRTNRETPTKHSDYIDAILLPIQSFKNSVSSARLDELWDKVGTETCNQVLLRYQAQVREVLTSVQRMEDSLKRLKKIKGQSMNNPSATSGDAKVLSDDDKIRCQIQLDVNQFASRIKELCPVIDTTSVNKVFERNNVKS